MPALKRKPKSPQQEAKTGQGRGKPKSSRQATTGSSERTASSAQVAGRNTGPAGGVQGVNVIILVLVAVAVIIAAGLLAETVNTARSIDRKATSIRETGIGINKSTDAIRQLVETNKIATSIRKTAAPLDGSLTKIVSRARSINRSAASIDSLASTILSTAGTINTSATTINGTAGEINSTAGEINSTAGSIANVAGGIRNVAGTINRTAKAIRVTAAPGPGILGIARIIDNDAALIVGRLNTTVGIARGIKVDSGNILGEAGEAIDNAACIDRKLPGADAGSNCAGKP